MLDFVSLLKGAEEVCIRKPVRPEYGGGNKEFVFEDQHFFVGSDDSTTFFTSQERQCIVHHMLFNLRAHQGDALDTVRFLEGQAIGRKVRFVLILMSNDCDLQLIPQYVVMFFICFLYVFQCFKFLI